LGRVYNPHCGPGVEPRELLESPSRGGRCCIGGEVFIDYCRSPFMVLRPFLPIPPHIPLSTTPLPSFKLAPPLVLWQVSEEYLLLSGAERGHLTSLRSRNFFPAQRLVRYLCTETRRKATQVAVACWALGRQRGGEGLDGKQTGGWYEAGLG